MRYLAVLLGALLVLIQYPLWYGKGGWLRVWELETELAEQRRVNEERRLRNAALAAEVSDLRAGTDAIEEVARARLGMVKPGELFIHIREPNPADAASLGQVAGSSLGAPSLHALQADRSGPSRINGVPASPVAAVAR
jgi:cell division protein FtsB